MEKNNKVFDVIKIIPAPGPSCQGLTWDGQYLWVTDITKDSLYQVDTANGNIIKQFATTPTNHTFEGLAWDGQYIWASHYESGTLYNPQFSKINPANGNIVYSFIPMIINCWPHGIAWDGQYLWSNDFHYHQIIKFDPNLGAPLDFIVSPGDSGSIGLTWFNNTLITADFNTDSMYQIDPITKQVINQWESPYTNPRDMEFDGTYLWFVAWEIQKIYKISLNISDVENNTLDEFSFILNQNFPNPFNPHTRINWQSPVGSWQTLKIYDVLGNEVATLIDEYKPAGRYEVEFNGHSGEGRNLSSGVYFYQLRIGGSETSSGQSFLETKKMILLK